jgi:hypothetical protein
MSRLGGGVTVSLQATWGFFFLNLFLDSTFLSLPKLFRLNADSRGHFCSHTATVGLFASLMPPFHFLIVQKSSSVCWPLYTCLLH